MSDHTISKSNIGVSNFARESSALKSAAIANSIIVFIIGVCAMWLSGASNSPAAAILVLDIALCAYLFSLFKTKYSLLFFVHPIILFAGSQLFSSPFLSGGDGDAYVAVVGQYIDPQTLAFTGIDLFDDYSLLEFFKYTSIGIAPVIAIPEYFFGDAPDYVFYLWQGTMHVLLVTLVVVLALSWNVFEKKTLLTIALFSAVSPSFFDLGSTPTRHIVTFYGVFLLYVTHVAVVRYITADRLLWFGIAVIVVIISKWVLLLPYLIFAFVDFVFIYRVKISIKHLFFISLLLLATLFMMPGLLATTEQYLGGTASTGAATFSGLTQIPIFGWVVKYLYALLAPFPWAEAQLFISEYYSGNWLLFLMHTLSSLSGLYIFLVVIIHFKRLLKADADFKRKIYYPLIMSLSILAGSTGFHSYLLIYFPMLAPLILHRQFRINILIPVCIVVLLEIFIMVAK